MQQNLGYDLKTFRRENAEKEKHEKRIKKARKIMRITELHPELLPSEKYPHK